MCFGAFIDMIYLCRALQDDIVPQESKICGVGWFTFEQIKALKTFDNVIKTISQALSYINT